MEKLPAFIATSKRTLNLYVNSYINVLPFLILSAFCEYASFKFFNSHSQENINPGILLLEFLVSTLFYVMVICGVYMTHMKNFNIIEVIKISFKRFFPFLCTVIILILPMILFFVMLTVVMLLMGVDPALLSGDLSDSNNNVKSNLIILISLAYLIYALIMIYFWPSALLIIGKNMGPIMGLKTSWQLVRGYWLETFGVVFAYTILILIIYYILGRLVPILWLKPLASLLFTSLGAALLVIVVEYLETKKSTSLVDTKAP